MTMNEKTDLGRTDFEATNPERIQSVDPSNPDEQKIDLEDLENNEFDFLKPDAEETASEIMQPEDPSDLIENKDRLPDIEENDDLEDSSQPSFPKTEKKAVKSKTTAVKKTPTRRKTTTKKVENVESEQDDIELPDPDSEPDHPAESDEPLEEETEIPPVDLLEKPDISELGTESPDSKTESEENPDRSRRTRRRQRGEPILSIDEQRSVQTTEDRTLDDLLDLAESLKGRKILTGTIQGVERSEDNPNLSFAVIYHGELKVIIPAEETVDPPADFRDRSPGDVMHYLITKRLGAEIDYIVKGVDPDSGLAMASRLEAMAARRRDYYYGQDRNGNNLIYEGSLAEARVVSVIRAGIFVDLFGVETYIPLRELSYQRLLDAASQYQAGQRVLVKVLQLDRSDRNHIQVTASVKQAADNPYEKALRRYNIGNRYVGTVSMVDTNGVFVSLDGGIDCLCSYPKRGRPPRGSRVTVRILGINNESNRIWGAITHMTNR